MTTLQEYIDSGRLIRNQWTGTDAQGRTTACLLAALSPDVAHQHSAAACPASIMPSWLARLTPWIDDAGTEKAWPAMVQRYADLAARWHVLTPDDWIRLDYMARRIAVESVLPYAGQASDVARQVIDLLLRAETGDTPTPDEFRAARAAARAAAYAAARAAYAADVITSSIFDAIEARIVVREQPPCP